VYSSGASSSIHANTNRPLKESLATRRSSIGESSEAFGYEMRLESLPESAVAVLRRREWRWHAEWRPLDDKTLGVSAQEESNGLGLSGSTSGIGLGMRKERRNTASSEGGSEGELRGASSTHSLSSRLPPTSATKGTTGHVSQRSSRGRLERHAERARSQGWQSIYRETSLLRFLRHVVATRTLIQADTNEKTSDGGLEGK